MIKPSHKFFERYLNNDLDDLFLYLDNKVDEMLSGQFLDIPKEELSKFNKINGPSTQLGKYYNIFTFKHEGINNLRSALKEIIIEACDYYGLNFDDLEFYINGWFNLDYKTHKNSSGVNPLKNEMFFHDHMQGEGAPVFHGYYCVNAEPSSTFYKINGESIFENVNKNNRAIVSETGHPHGRDDWFEEKPRITIAYDISPKDRYINSRWIKL
jgi:hypothetical protein